MRHSCWLLCLPLFWFAAGPLPAQEKPATHLYEEVEILRHLLKAKLADGYAQASKATGQYSLELGLEANTRFPGTADLPAVFYGLTNQQPQMPLKANVSGGLAHWYGTAPQGGDKRTQYLDYLVTAHRASETNIEGVHVRGQGLLFTITMPAWPQANRIRLVSQVQPASEWEQARRQLQGEGGTVEITLDLQLAPSLKEVLLKVLAENGRHLKHLGDGESVTLVVIFRGAAGTHQYLYEPVPYEPVPLPGTSPQPKPATVKPPAVNVPTQTDPRTPPRAGNQTPSDQQTMLDSYRRLADLHAKQGRYDEARKAFEEALKLVPEEGSISEASEKSRRELLKQALQFYMALENLSADDAAKMRKTADELTRMQTKVVKRQAKTQTGEAAARLPSRLVITAPKRVLQQAGEGKLNLAAFEKLVQIEEVTWGK